MWRGTPRKEYTKKHTELVGWLGFLLETAVLHVFVSKIYVMKTRMEPRHCFLQVINNNFTIRIDFRVLQTDD